MKSLAKLKDEARRYEQDEDWPKAIDAYLRVLKHGEDGESDVDLPLFNRVGDLYVRLGEGEAAVAYYETAADRYAEAGLFNNAIALCNKALRYAPDRDDLLRKLGQFSASQGFLSDARRWYLEYAERMFRATALDDAFSALDDFAGISDDPSIREILGRRLHAHGRNERAVAELKRAWTLRMKAGESAAADALRSEIYEIDPEAGELELDDAPVSAPPAKHGGRDYSLPGLVELTDEDTTADGAGADASVASPEVAAEAPAPGRVGADDAVEQIAGLEPTHLGDDDLPTARGETMAADRVSPSDAVDESEDHAALPELPGYDDVEPQFVGDDAGEDVDEPLALLAEDGRTLESADSWDGIGVFEASAADDSVGDTVARARAATHEGRREDAVILLEALYPRLSGAGRNLDAARILDELVELEPDRVDLHRARIEALTAAAASVRLVDALVALAGALERSGAPQHARAVYQQVLEMEPGNDAANRAVQPAAAPVSGAGGRKEYVDLGAFLTADDEAVGDSTRFFVAEKEPTGDEDRDFAELLAQFKRKVAEGVPEDDAGSHYDLGLAYKEMGLIDEAIGEFQVALRAGDGRLKIFEELGHCFLAKGQHGIAVKVLGRALEGRRDDELELIGVYYYLGRAYEELGERDRARDAYERVLALEVGFQDVGERLLRL